MSPFATAKNIIEGFVLNPVVDDSIAFQMWPCGNERVILVNLKIFCFRIVFRGHVIPLIWVQQWLLVGGG